MIIATFKYKEEEYNLRLTNEAKRRIEVTQKEKLEVMGKGEVLKLMAKQQRLQNELKKQTDEGKIEKINAELDDLSADVAPYLVDLLDSMDDTDYESIPWILLSSDHKYKDKVSKPEFDEMLLSLEDEKGFAEYNAWLIEIAEKVFTAIGEVKKLKEEKLNKAEGEISPVPQMMN